MKDRKGIYEGDCNGWQWAQAEQAEIERQSKEHKKIEEEIGLSLFLLLVYS
ncbi:hypothetical protein [Candidatus Nitrosocosmicus franklandus]|nr:hypothetical protein [Candidatus Nitrosocosmicus franklandus]